MHLTVFASLAAALVSGVFAAPPQYPNHPPFSGPPSFTSAPASAGTPAPQAFVELQNNYVKNTRMSLGRQGCTNQNIAIRRYWGDLRPDEQKDYLRAANCMAAAPSRVSRELCPGCRNRLDDFTWIHINQTNIIHNSGYLLPWHREFVFQMEQAMRKECGYKGYMPYWDTGRFADDQTKSPVFDGSATSFGGDGLPVPHNFSVGFIPGLATGPFPLPKLPGSGGGCVTNGPFSNLTLHLGPVVVAQPDPHNLYGLQPNPRCMTRDMLQPASAANLTWTRMLELASEPDIQAFRTRLEPTLHLMGHLAIGGDGADPFTPSNDPVFYLFHAHIDRIWAIWQGQNPATRTYAIDGPRTFFGIPLADDPHANPPSNSSAALTDVMDLGLGGKMTVKSAMSATEDGRCYIYM